ncbi:MAG TPA: heparan-alpha-glucosaminide N-acetyltransferase domain-containing protein [Acidobacteriaceae bacterium]|nr:heparan-alpha-glucosaminide N-acetyltransferase domain-containing protein [Acidobacteriaceae bacterium]
MAATTFSAPASTRTDRVLSLDIARGITIAFMIMVNNHGAAPYHPFEHSAWSGWTPTDLVFPAFLFMVGASIVLSFDKRLERGTPKRVIAVSIIRRSIILFALGLVVNGFPYFHLGTLRIYGVLQRIALCYLCAGLLYLWRRDAATKVAAIVVLLVGYWILMRFVPVPGAGVPTHNIPLLDPNQNWVAWLDRKLLPGRLYEGVRDPEGLLSTFPAIGTALLGVLAGIWLRARKSQKQITAGLIIAGVVLIGLAELWNLSFPINKRLWTSSYVLFAGGCAVLLLGALYWLLDVMQWRKALKQPWIVFGTNAIFAYMLSELLASTLGAVHPHAHETLWAWIYKPCFSHIHPVGIGSLLYSIAFAAVCWLVTYPLWKRRIFLKI